MLAVGGLLWFKGLKQILWSEARLSLFGRLELPNCGHRKPSSNVPTEYWVRFGLLVDALDLCNIRSLCELKI